MEEIWKDVKGFESLYMVSNLGRVKNVPHYVTRKYYRPSTGDNVEYILAVIIIIATQEALNGLLTLLPYKCII